MEYIPDGLSKKQWEEIKKKEEEEIKKKDFGRVGITKFQSRSFEAWQKSGQKNLFPVDPKAPIETKPYMQRPGGKPDGSDLKAKGLQGFGFGVGVPLNLVDKKYEQLEKEGKLRSSPFSLPWTNESLKDINKSKTAFATKSPSTSSKSKPTETPVTKEDKPKKGFFGLF
eukprot:gene16958-22450_t